MIPARDPRVREALLLEWLRDRAPFGVVYCTPEGVVDLNLAAAKLLGFEENVVPVEQWDERVQLFDAGGRWITDPEERPLFRALNGEHVPRTRMQVRRQDGARIDVNVEAFPLPAVAQDCCAVAVVEDISWTLKGEREQAEWLGALAHELNGGIQHFLSSSQAAQLYLGRDSTRVVHHLQNALGQAQHLRRLVRDFIEAARVGAGMFTTRDERILINALVAEVAETAELGDSRHRVLLEVEDDLWARCDAGRVRQILTNLFSNAAKYSTPGLLTLGARREEGRVLLWLKDEGPGIPPAGQAILFARFGRLPSRNEGAGLGLWIARELALRMGGDLWVESCEGGPTTFYIALASGAPLAGQAAGHP